MRHRPALVLCMLVAGLPGIVRAQASGPVSVRQAEREIRIAQARMYDLYTNARSLDISGPTCYETELVSCFHGDRECIRCVWENGPRDLALMYDRTAAMVARAPAGVDTELLDWLWGQRVGVWARLGIIGRAHRAVEDCRGSLWWCESLRAFVEHLQGDYEQSEWRFRSTLRIMRAGHACYWNELSFYQDTLTGAPGHRGSIGFDGFGRHRYNPKPDDNRPCPDPDDVDAFWVLADPLFTRPGNDRMTEHFARHVDLRIHEQHLEYLRAYHARGHHTLVLRYGWPTGFDVGRIPLAPVQLGQRRGTDLRTGIPPENWSGAVFGEVGQSFLVTMPVAEALVAHADVFSLAYGRSIELYRPAYGPVQPIPLQTGFFRRGGDPVLLVRASVPPPDSTLETAAAKWATRSWDGHNWRDADVVRAGDTLTSWLATPWQPQVVSLEGIHARGAYRARTGNRPPQNTRTAAISSLVLIDGQREPANLADAARAMLPTTSIAPDKRVGGYWELYTDVTRRAVIGLAIKPIDTGFLSSIGIGRPAERAVEFTEEMTPVNGVVARTVVLDLGDLPAGAYDIVLTLTLDNGDVLRTVTRIVVSPTRRVND